MYVYFKTHFFLGGGGYLKGLLVYSIQWKKSNCASAISFRDIYHIKLVCNVGKYTFLVLWWSNIQASLEAPGSSWILEIVESSKLEFLKIILLVINLNTNKTINFLMFVDLRPAEIPLKSFALQKYLIKPFPFFVHRNDCKLIKNQDQWDGVNGILKKITLPDCIIKNTKE